MSETMQIRVRNQAGDEVTFKVKPETKFGKIFDAYAGQKGIDVKAITFRFDGARVTPDDTPKMLEVSRPFLLQSFAHISIYFHLTPVSLTPLVCSRWRTTTCSTWS